MIRSRYSASSSRLRLLLLLGILCLGGMAHAQELGDGLQTHGFIAQSVVRTSANKVGGDSEDSLGWDLREMGANLSWRPAPDWLISGQALARWAGESDRGKLRLDYGFVDRTLLADGTTQVGLRLGKIKNPYGFHNTTRDVAHTRPGIIMPQSIYQDQMRDFFLAAPGVSLYGNHEGSQGNISWQISGLRPEVDNVELEHVFLLGSVPGNFEGKDSWLGQVMFDAGGRWRLGLSMGKMNMRFPALGGHHSLPTWVLSTEHNSEAWSFTAEYGETTVKGRNYPMGSTDNTTEAWYIQATRRLGNGWQGYLRYDVLYYDKEDKDGTNFAGNPFVAVLGFPDHSRFARDWVVGLRKDVGAWTVSGELHRVYGTAWLSLQDNPVPRALVRRWNMFLLQAAWRF